VFLQTLHTFIFNPLCISLFLGGKLPKVKFLGQKACRFYTLVSFLAKMKLSLRHISCRWVWTFVWCIRGQQGIPGHVQSRQGSPGGWGLRGGHNEEGWLDPHLPAWASSPFVTVPSTPQLSPSVLSFIPRRWGFNLHRSSLHHHCCQLPDLKENGRQPFCLHMGISNNTQCETARSPQKTWLFFFDYFHQQWRVEYSGIAPRLPYFKLFLLKLVVSRNPV
jgi:hypothetical protein